MRAQNQRTQSIFIKHISWSRKKFDLGVPRKAYLKIYDGSSSTYVHLKNVTDDLQHYTFQLSFAGGVYSLGLKTVEPRQVITLDIRALRDQQVPDEQGVTIPATATRGQIMWSVRGSDGLAMIGRSEQIDEVTGLSSNYACQNCCPNSVNNVFVDPQSGSTVTVDGVTTYTAKQEDRTCYGQVLTPYTVNNANWSSSNTSVATVTGGQAHGQGPGGRASKPLGWPITTTALTIRYHLALPEATLSIRRRPLL